jgi:ring-1,2-phenylacetyl-CoA epoxidase subunit PaaD
VTAVYVSDFETKTGVTAEQKAWDIAATVCDPEIPVLTIEDLGILRSVRLFDDGGPVPAVQVTITPTYSGCPAMDAIRDDLKAAFHRRATPACTWSWCSRRRGPRTG